MRRLLAITLAALIAIGSVAYATVAIRASRQPLFTLSASPGHQSAVRGGTARFSIEVARSQRSNGPIKLTASGLPRGASASWQLADGTRSRVVPPSETGAILVVRTSLQTPLATRRVKVRARGGGAIRARALALTVVPIRLRRYSLKVTPSRQVVAQGAKATYRIHIARAARFHRRVALRMLRLPRGATAKWTTNAVAVTTSARQVTGSHRLVLQGTSWVGGRAVRRNAVVVLSVVRARALRVRGDLPTLLYPGASAPLDLTLTNPHRFDLRVVALSVRIRSNTSRPGCSADTNYAVSQYRGRYPLRLRPGSTRLSAFGGGLPLVSMHDLPADQAACKGAVVSLAHRATATR